MLPADKLKKDIGILGIRWSPVMIKIVFAKDFF